MADCKDILVAGLYNEYEHISEENFKAELKLVVSMTSDERKKYSEEHNTDITGSFKKLLELGFSNGENTESYDELHKSLQIDEDLAWQSSAYNKIIARTVDKNVVEAWSKCMSTSMRGIQTSLSGDISNKDGQFILNLNYFPSSQTDKERLITKISIVGANVVNEGSLVENSNLKPFSGASSILKRTGKSAVSIIIDFDGFNSVTADMIEIPLPPIENISQTYALNAFGVWPRISGDDEMDTDDDDTVPVRSSSRIYQSGSSILLDYSFYCEEDGGDHTIFSGTHTVEIYKIADSKKLIALSAPGGLTSSFVTSIKGENHGYYDFNVNNTFWSRLLYRIDSDGNDNGVVGIGGTLSFTVQIQEIEA